MIHSKYSWEVDFFILNETKYIGWSQIIWKEIKGGCGKQFCKWVHDSGMHYDGNGIYFQKKTYILWYRIENVDCIVYSFVVGIGMACSQSSLMGGGGQVCHNKTLTGPIYQLFWNRTIVKQAAYKITMIWI